MSRRFSIGLASLLASAGVSVFMTPRTAYAGKAEATVADIFDTGNLAAQGRTAVSAFSQQNAVTNNTLATTVIFNGAAQQVSNNAPLPFLGTSTNAPAIGNLKPVAGIFGRYVGPPPKPSFGLFKGNLTKINDQYTINSTTGDYTSEGSAYITLAGNRRLFASADDNNSKNRGSAAGRATDPITVPSGSYSYDPTITGSISVTQAGESAFIHHSVIDSFVSDPATVDGYDDATTPPTTSLWSLDMNADTPTTSTASVTPNFVINPMALSEIQYPSGFITSIGGPFGDPNTEALAIDAATNLLVQSQFTLGAGEVDMNNLHIFPAGTMYVPSGTSVEYLDDAQAGISAVPEPGMVSLMILGAAAISTRRRRGALV